MYVPTSALQVRGLARRRAYAVHRGPQRARARARPHTTSLRPRKSEEEKRTCCTATSSRVSTAVREVVFPVSRETLALGLTVGGPIDWLSTGRVLWAMLWRQGAGWSRASLVNATVRCYGFRNFRFLDYFVFGAATRHLVSSLHSPVNFVLNALRRLKHDEGSTRRST